MHSDLKNSFSLPIAHAKSRTFHRLQNVPTLGKPNMGLKKLISVQLPSHHPFLSASLGQKYRLPYCTGHVWYHKVTMLTKHKPSMLEVGSKPGSPWCHLNRNSLGKSFLHNPSVAHVVPLETNLEHIPQSLVAVIFRCLSLNHRLHLTRCPGHALFLSHLSQTGLLDFLSYVVLFILFVFPKLLKNRLAFSSKYVKYLEVNKRLCCKARGFHVPNM